MVIFCVYVLLVQQFCLSPLTEGEKIQYEPWSISWIVPSGERFYTNSKCAGCTIYNLNEKKIYVEWLPNVVFRDGFDR